MVEYSLDNILRKYQTSFIDKVYSEENEEYDLLMDVFDISPDIKRENRQYWGRELGMCWQLLVIEICENYCQNFQPAFKIGNPTIHKRRILVSIKISLFLYLEKVLLT